MTDRRREPDEVLPAKVAERLLKRASELDAVRNSGTAVAELRAAAAEAGISADAFDAALGELKTADQVPAPVAAASTKRWRRLFFGLAGVGAFALLAATVVIPMRLVAPVPASAVETETFQLICLPVDRAMDLIRPLLVESRSSVVRPSNAPNTLIVSGTPDAMQKMRSLLDQTDAQSCARR